jgi:hypothetical protein
MGDGIGGPVVKCLSGNAFELDVTHYRKDKTDALVCNVFVQKPPEGF